MIKKMAMTFVGILMVSTSRLQASDKPPVAPVPGQTAVDSPTPQPPQQGTAMEARTAPIAGASKQDKNGVPELLVEFETDRYDIPSTFVPQLNTFGDYLKRHSGSTAELAGYADNSGHGPANGSLAQKRANAVLAYLTSHYGISVTRIKAEGYGTVTDKSNNSTAASKQADRRVYGKIITAPKS